MEGKTVGNNIDQQYKHMEITSPARMNRERYNYTLNLLKLYFTTSSQKTDAHERKYEMLSAVEKAIYPILQLFLQASSVAGTQKKFRCCHSVSFEMQ